MDTPNAPARIPLDDAGLPELKTFAELALGIEVKPGTNATQLRAKIKQAMPDCKDVPPLPEAPVPIVTVPTAPPPVATLPVVEGENPAARPAAVSRPASAALMHSRMDPKVKLRFLKTDDKRRSKDVTMQVNGDTWRARRGEVVEVPLRVYLMLLNAKEHVAVETDEINPITQLPVMAWEEIPSYPCEVLSMPSDAEIAAWHEATRDGFKQAA